MLDKNVFFENMDKLVMAFPNWKLDFQDADVMRFWYSEFKGFENKRFTHMVTSYIRNESFNPTIKGLRDHDTMPRKTRDQIEHEKMLKEMGYYD